MFVLKFDESIQTLTECAIVSVFWMLSALATKGAFEAVEAVSRGCLCETLTFARITAH
jgi:hypothetical protein